MPASELDALRLRLNEVADRTLPIAKIVSIGLIALLVGGALLYNLLIPTGPDVESLPRAKSSTEQVGKTKGPEASSPTAGSESTESPATSATEPTSTVVVQVAGAVKSPGVFALDSNLRVNDAVTRAGGLAIDADAARVNLAAKVADGQQIVVPKIGEAGVSPVAVAGAAVGAGQGGSGKGDGLININTADVAALEELPGIGPSLAQAIIDHRKTNGPFKSVDQLNDVKGIGEAKFSQLVSKVSV